MTDYGMRQTLPGVSLEDAIERVTAELKREGFGVLTKIDVQQTLKDKLQADFRPYVILGACNPLLAHQALLREPDLGLLLPCNVVVQEIDGGVQVSAIDPRVMGQVATTDLRDLMEDAADRLQRALTKAAS
jgi:uncharacterized protein (DUF302 family)